MSPASDRAAPAPAPSADHVAAVALAGLPEIGPARLRALVDHYRSPAAALGAALRGDAGRWLCAGRSRDGRDVLVAASAHWPERLDPGATRHLLTARGARVWLDGEPGYPIVDVPPRPPLLLLAEGARPDALVAPRVAVVGTRSATPHGLADAHELGATLADAGVTVVSGLAVGIDGAAHRGAVEAGGLTIGVVATGLDVEYPRRHRDLYRDVRANGLVLGESGYGIGPSPGRFPVRNRIIAALADVVVVVEATVSGGARITAEQALGYQRTVFAVPGSRRNAAAAGTNALLIDGAQPLTEWADVLINLGMTPGSRRAAEARAEPDRTGRAVLTALAGEPAAPEQLAARTGIEPGALALAIGALERTGWVTWSKGLVWPR